jgi:hypothetical protein
MITLPWRRAEPAVEDDIDLDVPAFMRADGTWKSGLRAVRERPLEWSTALPASVGLWLMRRPGAEQRYWKVINVHLNGEGVLVSSWTDIAGRPMSEWTGREWCRIREPRERRG